MLSGKVKLTFVHLFDSFVKCICTCTSYPYMNPYKLPAIKLTQSAIELISNYEMFYLFICSLFR